MNTSLYLTLEEKHIAKKIDKYFKASDMAFRDKITHAILIAQHELEAQYFSSESEKQKIMHFKAVSDNLLKKINNI